MDYSRILSFIRPGEEWTVTGTEYEDIIWHSNTDKPSLDEIFNAKDLAEKSFLFQGLRMQRNRLLVESDWTQVADAPVNQADWAEYRQALRDLPANTIDPENPIWPIPPNEGGD